MAGMTWWGVLLLAATAAWGVGIAAAVLGAERERRAAEFEAALLRVRAQIWGGTMPALREFERSLLAVHEATRHAAAELRRRGVHPMAAQQAAENAAARISKEIDAGPRIA